LNSACRKREEIVLFICTSRRIAVSIFLLQNISHGLESGPTFSVTVGDSG